MSFQDLQRFSETWLIPAQLVFTMFGMGATLTLSDFQGLLRDPRGVSFGLVLQLFGVPALAAFIGKLTGAEPGFALGLIVVASVPGGASSNLLTYIGRGNVPLSIAITSASTVGCVLTLPWVVGFFGGDVLSADFNLPSKQILFDVARYLFLPLGIGMVVLAKAPKIAPAFSKWTIRISIACLIIMTIAALGSGKIDPIAYGWRPPARLVLFAATLAIVTPHLARLIGRSDADALALGVEVTVRNVAIALLLVRFFFPESPDQQGQVLFSCLFYSGLSFPFSVLPIARHRLGYSPALGRGRATVNSTMGSTRE